MPSGDPVRGSAAPSGPGAPDRGAATPQSPQQPQPAPDPRGLPGAPAHAAAARRDPDAPDATPRASHEDVMRRASELRERQREMVPGERRND